MDIILYEIPNIPVPVSSLLCFALAVAVLALTRTKALGDVLALILVALGSSLAIIADCDLTLLAALILCVLCAYLLIARSAFKKSGSGKGGN